jgi:hypothetical protein
MLLPGGATSSRFTFGSSPTEYRCKVWTEWRPSIWTIVQWRMRRRFGWVWAGDWSGGRGEDWRWDRMAANLRSFRVSGASQDLVG